MLNSMSNAMPAPAVAAAGVSRPLQMPARPTVTANASFRRGGLLTQRRTATQTASSSTAEAAVSTTPAAPEVAVLPGTPKDFSVPEATMLEWAQRLFDANNGIDDDSLLAEDFRFEFPIISLARAEYLKAVRGFKLQQAFPNITSRPYHWRVDPYEPNRVWFTVRTTGTHLGALNFGAAKYEPTGKEYYSAPECLSYTFSEDGKCTSFTGGYVMDRRVGNTDGLGALFGTLKAIGVTLPTPGTLSWKVATAVNRIVTTVKGWFNKE